MENDNSQRESYGAKNADHKKQGSNNQDRDASHSSGRHEDGARKDRKNFTDRERRPAPRKFAGRGDRRPRPDFGPKGDDARSGRKPWEKRTNEQRDGRDNRDSRDNRDGRSNSTHGDRKPRSFNAESRDRRDSYGNRDGRNFREDREHRGDRRPAYGQDRQNDRDFEARRPPRPSRDASYGDRDQRPRQDYDARDRRPRSADDRAPRFQDRDRRPSYNDRERRPYAEDGQRRYPDSRPARHGEDRQYRSPSQGYEGQRRPRPDYPQGQNRPDRQSYDRRPPFAERNAGHERGERPYRERPPRSDYPASERGRNDAGFERRPREGFRQERTHETRSFQERTAYADPSTQNHEGNAPYAEQAAPIDGGSTYSSPLMEGTPFTEASSTKDTFAGHEQDIAAIPAQQDDAPFSRENETHENAPYAGASHEGAPYGERSQHSAPAYFTDMNRPFGRGGRGARGDKRPPLRETVMNMDKDLLKVLARRCNILGKMKAKSGHLEVREEKEIRASWEKTATQMTRDPRIIHQLFALMQEITFSAKPEEGMAKRTGFNLAPPPLPVGIRMHAPLVSRRSRLFLAMAGASGSACRMAPSLLDDASVECIKMFNQCATSLAWDDDGTLISREGGGLSLPDKVIFVGDDILNFFLLLGHYVSQNTRAKFTGESALKKADLTSVRSFLPQLGARISNVMPNSSGFPIRLECSGILPETVDIPEDVPADFVLGLLLAAPFWENSISFDLRFHPQAESIMEEALAILTPCKAKVRRENDILFFNPSNIKTPSTPELGMDLQFAAYILALPLAQGGQVQLDGLWPVCPTAEQLEKCMHFFGLITEKSTSGIHATHPRVENPQGFGASTSTFAVQESMEAEADFAPEDNTDPEDGFTADDILTAEENFVSHENDPAEEILTEEISAEEGFTEEKPMESIFLPASALWQDPRFTPLLAACAYILALRHQGKKRIVLPAEAPVESLESFFNHLGFEYVEDGFTLDVSRQRRDPATVWTAPTPAWALAFALAAAAKPHIKLSNPGIMTNLYPQFWNLYNALPSFDIKKNVTEQKNDKPVRRRIIAADQERTGNGDSTDRHDA